MNRYMKSLWNLKEANAQLGGKREFTDIDGTTEYRGHFLMLETKNRGVTMLDGQRIMYEKLVETGLFTVIVVRGDANVIELPGGRYELGPSKVADIEVWYPNGARTPCRPATNEDLNDLIRRWDNMAHTTRPKCWCEKRRR